MSEGHTRFHLFPCTQRCWESARKMELTSVSASLLSPLPGEERPMLWFWDPPHGLMGSLL